MNLSPKWTMINILYEEQNRLRNLKFDNLHNNINIEDRQFNDGLIEGLQLAIYRMGNNKVTTFNFIEIGKFFEYNDQNLMKISETEGLSIEMHKDPVKIDPNFPVILVDKI